jgi:hypothetical protein
METQSQFLVGLRNLNQEESILLSLESVLGSLQELDGVLDVLELPGAGDGDEGVLNGVETGVQVLHQLVVEANQLVALSRAVEHGFLDILGETVGELVP